MAVEPLLFVNVGWMKRYDGQSDDDLTIGNHGYLKDHKWGHEAWNFRPYRGNVYGYVPGRASDFDLTKLGALKSAESVDGVIAIFIAREPRSKQTRIVGWYRNATVYKRVGHATIARAPNVEVQYCIVANHADATLLDALQRPMQIPTAKVAGNLGQSPRWYGSTDAFRDKVRQYVDSGGALDSKKRSRPNKSPRNPNPEIRKMIEVAAVRHATEFYESMAGGSWQIQSVEQDSAGWDLTATRSNETLKIEVKGLSGNVVCVELTPNEFKKMLSLEHRSDYVIYVVTEAGTSRAMSHVFYYNALVSKGKQHIWIAEDGRKLEIKELTGARLTATSGQAKPTRQGQAKRPSQAQD